METSELKQLKERAREAMRGGRWGQALEAIQELERHEPGEPTWPRRRADVLRRMGDRAGELRAWVRAAELYAESGLVVQAIAACKLILARDPQHVATQQRLERLGALRDQSAAPHAEPVQATDLTGRSKTTPLEEVLLNDVVPGAQPAALYEDAVGSVAEIPLDDDQTAGELDLGLSGMELPVDLGQMNTPASRSLPHGRSPARPDLDVRTDVVARADVPVEELRNTPLFGALDGAALRSMIERVRLLEIGGGEVLLRQGEPADALYIVVDGAVVPIAESREPEGQRTRLAVLEAGAFFGEIGLVTNQPRNATVEALVDTRLLVIDRSAMWDLVRSHPAILRVLLRFLRERLADRLVRTSPLFGAFARAERSALARQFRFLEVRDGTAVVQQQQAAPALFVVLSGHLEVILMDTDGDKTLAALGPGDLCGERSILTGEPAMASVLSRGKSWLLALDAARFRRILDRNPRLQEVIEGICESRMRANDATFRKAIRDGDGRLGLI